MISGASAGYFRSGLPYNPFGHGPRPLVIFQGLVFENKPWSGAVTRMYNFKKRLAQITAPTLVAAGDRDPFYTPALFRETAEGIPNARLILYPDMGHPASGKQFRRDVLAFLREDRK
jgi:pimeloyl-ACP methyl ester carboxylesterase